MIATAAERFDAVPARVELMNLHGAVFDSSLPVPMRLPIV
jgi:hypothetical protein